MKVYRTTSGPFLERPYYTNEEIELICFDELQKVNLIPSEPEPIRIERFVEKKFKISPKYGDLPEGILGCIQFGPQGVSAIIISRKLDQEGTRLSERRINTTLAHESGHGLLHAHLFVLGEKPVSLFEGEDSPEPKILCRKDSVLGVQGYNRSGYTGRWWEYQANLVIGPLLLPRSLVIKTLEPFLLEKGMMRVQKLDPSHREEAERILAEVFSVNPIVARIRLEGLFPVAQDNQLTL